MPDDVRTLAERVLKTIGYTSITFAGREHEGGLAFRHEDAEKLKVAIADALRAYGEQQYQEGMKEVNEQWRKSLEK